MPRVWIPTLAVLFCFICPPAPSIHPGSISLTVCSPQPQTLFHGQEPFKPLSGCTAYLVVAGTEPAAYVLVVQYLDLDTHETWVLTSATNLTASGIRSLCTVAHLMKRLIDGRSWTHVQDAPHACDRRLQLGSGINEAAAVHNTGKNHALKCQLPQPGNSIAVMHHSAAAFILGSSFGVSDH